MAHILTATLYESSTSNYVTINDVKVDVPYELKNGDVIKIYSNNGDSSVMFLNGNGITNIWGTVIDLSDTDILYEETNFGPSDPFGDSGPVITINYTESTVSRKSIDLTTLPGWSSLSSGSHSITIVAKADGYRDSAPSEGVTVTKEAEADALAGTWVLNNTITFNSSLGLPNIVSFNFTSNDTSFYGFYFDVNSDGDNSLGYRTNQEYSFNEIYNSSGNIISGKEAYKTITITSKLSDVTNGDKLLTWLQANATKQS